MPDPCFASKEPNYSTTVALVFERIPSILQLCFGKWDSFPLITGLVLLFIAVGYPQHLNRRCHQIDISKLLSYSICISELVRFSMCCTSMLDYNFTNLNITIVMLCYRHLKLRKTQKVWLTYHRKDNGSCFFFLPFCSLVYIHTDKS